VKKISKTIQPDIRPSLNDWFKLIYAETNKGKGLTPERLGQTTETTLK